MKLSRYFALILSIITPASFRGLLLYRLGVLGYCGRNTLFCTINIGTEPALISLGDNTVIASNVTFVNHDMSPLCAARFSNETQFEIYGDISIGDNCFIGAGSIILPSVNICSNVVVGAGSVVRKNIIKPGVYAGNGPTFISELPDFYRNSGEKMSTRVYSLATKYPKLFVVGNGLLYKRSKFLVNSIFDYWKR